jgi:hypothetical protein
VTILIIIFSIAAVIASPHDDAMSQIEFNYEQTRTFTIGSRDIEISYHGKSSDEASDVFNHIFKSIEILPEFLNSGTRTCKTVDLDVYHIDYEDINDRSIMSFMRWESLGVTRITGAYDSIFSSPGRGSMFISRSSNVEFSSLTISHEVAHYWQDITCSSSNLEADARRFEKYYLKTVEGRQLVSR